MKKKKPNGKITVIELWSMQAMWQNVIEKKRKEKKGDLMTTPIVSSSMFSNPIRHSSVQQTGAMIHENFKWNFKMKKEKSVFGCTHCIFSAFRRSPNVIWCGNRSDWFAFWFDRFSIEEFWVASISIKMTFSFQFWYKIICRNSNACRSLARRALTITGS